MKEKIKAWWKQPIKRGYVVGAVVCVVLLISIFLLLGFRITYSPDLDNRWDVISAVSGWVGAVGSIAAVWAAVQIPKKIADRQDKIALFEKRVEAYEVVSETFAFSWRLVTALIDECELKQGGSRLFDKKSFWEENRKESAIANKLRYLFHDEVGNIAESLYETRQKIREKEALIEEGIQKIPAAELKEYYSIAQAEALWGVTQVEQNKMKNIARKNAFIHTEIIFDRNNRTTQRIEEKYDIYTLSEEEIELIEEADGLYNNLLQAMVKEIKIFQNT